MKAFNLIQKYTFIVLALLVLCTSTGANAAIFTLLLTAEGGDYDTQTLYTVLPPPDSALINVSTIEFDTTGITIGSAAGSYSATAIDINYFGTHYTEADAIGDVTIHFDDGYMTGIDYVTQDFTLEMLPTNHTGRWEGSVVITPVPTPGALALFSLALGSLGLRAVRKNS